MCRLCSALGGISSGLSAIDDQNTHARLHLLQLDSISKDGRTDLKQIFDQCFLQQKIETNSHAENEIRRSTLLKRCLRAFNNRNNNSDPLICQECGKSVTYISINRCGVPYINARSPVEHACSHLGKKLYGCRYCDYGTSWYSSICDHLKRIHKILSPTRNEDMVERWAVDFDAIEAILNKCYDVFDQDSKKKTLFPHIVRRRFCFELVKKYAPIDKKIECRLCRKAIVVRNGQKLNYILPIGHVFTHLKKPIFKCTLCSSSVTSRFGASLHAKCQHKSSYPKIIEDRSDNYHEEIMELLTKCFDKKETV